MPKPIPPITRVVAVVFAVATVFVLFSGSNSRKPSEPTAGQTLRLAGDEPPSGDDVVALLGGLKPGDQVESSTILAIDAPVARIVYVDAQQGQKAFSIGIGLAGTSEGKLPPITTDKYELGFGNVRGTGELEPGALQNTAEAIAQRIRKHEHQVPTPMGM